MSLAFDDAVLDRLAARTRRPSGRAYHHRNGEVPGDRVSELFARWQDRLAARPEPAALDVERAADLMASAPRRSALRPALAIAAAICALLLGSAAVGARTAQPGDPLFPVTQMLWTQQADSAVAGQQIQDIITIAKGEVAAGRLTHAADLLQQATRELSRVTGGQAHAQVQGDLMAVWALLSEANSVADQQVAADGSPLLSAPAPSGPPTIAGPAAGSKSQDGGSDSAASPNASISDQDGAGVGVAGTTASIAAPPPAGQSTGSAAAAPPGTPGGGSASLAPAASSAAQPPVTAVTTPPTTAPSAGSTPPSSAPPTSAVPTPTPATSPSSPPTTGTAPAPPGVTPSPTTPSAEGPTAPTTATSSSSPPAMTGQAMIMPAPPPETGQTSAASAAPATPPTAG